MEGVINPYYLTEEEIDYELEIRGTATRNTLNSKRIILTRLVELEKDKDITKYRHPNFSAAEDKLFIVNTLQELRNLISDFGGSTADAEYKTIHSRLVSLINRVKRFRAPHDLKEEKEYVEFKGDAFANCLELDAILSCKVTEKTDTRLSQEYNPDLPQFKNNNNVGPSTSKSVPVYKWGIYFNGKNISLLSFLEQVDELVTARGVSERELFRSAGDLFKGDIKIWYNARRRDFNSWEEIVKNLKDNFLQPDYDDELFEQIKKRYQGKSESVVIYIANMECLFARLSTPRSEMEKLKIIKERLLSRYVDFIILHGQDIKTTSELIDYCKRVDESERIKSKYVSPNKINFLESDLAYVGDTSSASSSACQTESINNNKIKHHSSKNKNNSNYNKKKSDSNISTVVCWNCKQPNHVFANCTKKPTKFCFRCGKSNFTKKDCPDCTKN